jgi:hypothetical protein
MPYADSMTKSKPDRAALPIETELSTPVDDLGLAAAINRQIMPS